MAIPSVGKSTCNKHMTKFEFPAPLLKLDVAVCTPVTPALLGEERGGSLGLAVFQASSRFSESTWLKGTRQRVTEQDTQSPLSVLLVLLDTHIPLHKGTYATHRHTHRHPDRQTQSYMHTQIPISYLAPLLLATFPCHELSVEGVEPLRLAFDKVWTRMPIVL